MKQKWYISTLIIILTVIGVVCEQQISVPNQEILLQFTDEGVTTEDTRNTLEIVKKQLQNLGVENIQVKEQEKGSIKITYYSDENVAIIKQTLSEENNLVLDYTSFSQDGQGSKLPSDENPIGYNLDVHEIHKGHDIDWGVNGKYVLEPNPKGNYVFNLGVYASFNEIDVKGEERIVKVAYKVNRNITIALDNASQNTPEVRAGPLC
jgi:hypothetical protein